MWPVCCAVLSCQRIFTIFHKIRTRPRLINYGFLWKHSVRLAFTWWCESTLNCDACPESIDRCLFFKDLFEPNHHHWLTMNQYWEIEKKYSRNFIDSSIAVLWPLNCVSHGSNLVLEDERLSGVRRSVTKWVFSRYSDIHSLICMLGHHAVARMRPGEARDWLILETTGQWRGRCDGGPGWAWLLPTDPAPLGPARTLFANEYSFRESCDCRLGAGSYQLIPTLLGFAGKHHL